MDVASCGDTVNIVDPTLSHEARVVRSTNCITIHSAFDSRRCSFFVGLSAFWAPSIPVTEPIANTDPLQVCKLCSPMPPPVLPDVMDVSNITAPTLISTVDSIIDSSEHRKFVALLPEAGEIERLEELLTEHCQQLYRQQERLANIHNQGQLNAFVN